MNDEGLVAPRTPETIEKPLSQHQLYQLVLILAHNSHSSAAKFALRLLEFYYAAPTIIKLD